MLRRAGVSALKILAFICIWAALTGGAVMAALAWGGANFFERAPFRVGLEIALTAAVLAAMFAMIVFVDRRAIDTAGFSSARLPDLLIGTVLGAGIFLLPIGALTALGAMRFDPDLSGFTAGALALGVVVCFFNVVTQQALARGYMFQELWAKFGPWTAAVVTTLFFVALHAPAIAQGAQGLIAGVNVALAGLMLSLAYIRSGSLWLPIGIHFGWNGLQGPVLGISVTGNDLAFGQWRVFAFAPGQDLMTGGAMGIEGGLVGLVGPAAGIALVAALAPKRPKPDFSARAK